MDDEDDGNGSGSVTPESAAQAMAPLEPYTTREVASLLEVPRRVARRLLDALYEGDEVEKKPPHEDGGRTIWIRPAPQFTCPECGYEFMVRVVHPVLASVRYCPQCGARVD
ncbi:MAG: hypothetical protein ABEJ74_05015 [Haloferacaceae archaeon]